MGCRGYPGTPGGRLSEEDRHNISCYSEGGSLLRPGRAPVGPDRWELCQLFCIKYVCNRTVDGDIPHGDEEVIPLLTTFRAPSASAVFTEEHSRVQVRTVFMGFILILCRQDVFIRVPSNPRIIPSAQASNPRHSAAIRHEEEVIPPCLTFLGYLFSVLAGLCFTASNIGIK